VLITIYNNDHTKEDEMNRAYKRHDRKEKCTQSFGRKSRMKDTTRKTWRVDGRIRLKCILKKCDGRVWTGFVWLRRVNSGRIL
jgi:hypothetical protein